jgi:hypothetical protein
MVYELNDKGKQGNPNQQTDTGQRANDREGAGQNEYTGGGGNKGGGKAGSEKHEGPVEDEQ